MTGVSLRNSGCPLRTASVSKNIGIVRKSATRNRTEGVSALILPTARRKEGGHTPPLRDRVLVPRHAVAAQRAARVRLSAAEPSNVEARNALVDLGANRQTEAEEERVQDRVNEPDGAWSGGTAAG